MTTLGKSLLALVITGLLPLGAHAHRTWLLPSSTVLDGKEPWVTIDAAVSDDLFDLGANAAKLDGLSVTGPDGLAVTPENQFTGRLRSSFDLKLSKPGTYKVGVVSESAMASYKLNGEQKRWRGTAETLSKDVPANAEDVRVTHIHSRQETFVTSGKPNTTALTTTGTGIELVPLTHPNEMLAGEKANFRFLVNGKPAAKLAFSVTPGGVRYRGVLKEMRLVTDDKGEVTFTWPEAGMYWINTTFPPVVRPATAPQGMEGQAASSTAPVAPQQQPERRSTYSATVEVLPQ